jgi:hypothetical protein
MATYAGLQSDIMAWLNRRDVAPLIPGWVSMVETDIAETLRARCMVGRATQAIDANFITLPVDFITFESVRDAASGLPLELNDHYTGSAMANGQPSTGYRLVGNCIEFLPHPVIPDPPQAWWTPAMVNIAYYQRPAPLVDPQDSNAILNQLYSVYLFGACRYGAMFELDSDRKTQMDGAFGDAVTQANLWKQASDFSGAPLREVVGDRRTILSQRGAFGRTGDAW